MNRPTKQIDIRNLSNFSNEQNKKVKQAFYVNLNNTPQNDQHNSVGRNMNTKDASRWESGQSYKPNNLLLLRKDKDVSSSTPQIKSKDQRDSQIDFISRNLNRFK